MKANALSKAHVPAAVRLAAGVGLLLVLLWSALLWDFRRHAEFVSEENHRDLEAVTESGAQALHFTVRSIDLLLLDLREQWESDPEGFDRKVRRREAEAGVADPFAIDVIGPDGFVLYSSIRPASTGMGSNDRTEFRAFGDGAARDQLAIVGPRPGPIAERRFIHFVRHLRSRDGNFAGIVAVSARPGYLLQMERTGHLPENTAMTVVRDDRSVLVRTVTRAESQRGGVLYDTDASGEVAAAPWPLPEWSRLDPRDSGFVRVRDPVDDTERLVSWRRLATYPLALVVGKPAALVDEEISRLRRRYLVAGALTSLLLLLALYWLLRTRRAREAAAARQREHLTELTRSAAELRVSQQQFRELAAHQMALKEDERKRIAQEIHDELGQRLTVLRMDLSMLPRAVGADRTGLLADQVSRLKSDLDDIMALVRDIAGRLRPATLDVGLGAAVEGLVEDLRAPLGMRCELDNRLPSWLALDDKRATAAFRIIQESLTNVVRHANASRVRVGLAVKGDDLLVQVHDDGRGLDGASARTKPSFGLSGMRERAAMLGGVVTITSEAGQGTRVEARIPLGETARRVTTRASDDDETGSA